MWLENVCEVMTSHAGLFQGVTSADGGMKGAKHQNHLEFLKYATCSIISALGLYTDYTSKQTMVYLENETELKEVILNWESYTHDIDFAEGSAEHFIENFGQSGDIDKLMSYVYISENEMEDGEEDQDVSHDYVVDGDMFEDSLLTAKAVLKRVDAWDFQTMDGSLETLKTEVENAIINYYLNTYIMPRNRNRRIGIQNALAQGNVEEADDLQEEQNNDDEEDDNEGNGLQGRRAYIFNNCLRQLMSKEFTTRNITNRHFQHATPHCLNGHHSVVLQKKGFTATRFVTWKGRKLAASIKEANEAANEAEYVLTHQELILVLVDHIEENLDGRNPNGGVNFWDFKRYLNLANMTLTSYEQMEEQQAAKNH